MRFKEWLAINSFEYLKKVGIRDGQTVLDIGCGTGTFTITSAKLVGEKGTVYALDVDEKALDQLRKKADREGLRNIVILHSSAEEKIKLDDKSIDHVLLIDILQDVFNRDALFDEAKRLLRDGGRVTVFPMHLEYDEVIKLSDRKDLKLAEWKFDDHIIIFTKNDFRNSHAQCERPRTGPLQ